MRSDAGHRKGRATRSENSEKTQALSPLGRVGGRQQALEITHIACALLPTRRDPGAIPMGHYHQDLVLSILSGNQVPKVLGYARQGASRSEDPDLDRDTPALIARKHKRSIADGYSRQHLGYPSDAQSVLRHRFQGSGQGRGRALLHEHGRVMARQHGVDDLAERRGLREI